MTTGTVSGDQLGVILDLKARRIRQLAARGVIQKAGRGGYELVPSIRGYLSYLRHLREARGGEEWALHRARKWKEQADHLELKNAIEKGQLLNRGDVHQAVDAAFALVRRRISRLPDEIAPMVVGMRETPTVKAVMEKAVHQALRELAGTQVVGGDGAANGKDGAPRRGADNAGRPL